MGIEKIFKPEILNSGGYKGGIAKVASNTQKIFKLSSNENYLGTSEAALKVLKTDNPQLYLYPVGTPQPLYEALSRHYEGRLTPDQFIAGNGGSDLIQVIARSFLGHGTNCIISTPCFSPYTMFSAWTGAQVIDVPLKGSEYELDVEGILDTINSNTRLIFLTSPNNPTGTYIKKKELEKLLDGIPDHLAIIYDEVYCHFTQAADYSIALPYVLKEKSVIGINSFSKAYGLAGMRIGYGYSTSQISAYIRKAIRPFLIDKLSMATALAALEDQEFVTRTAKIINENKSVLISGLQQLRIKYWPSEANFVMIRMDLDEHVLVEKMLKLGVMIRSVGNFGAPGCVRITIGDAESTEATLQALATILNKKL